MEAFWVASHVCLLPNITNLCIIRPSYTHRTVYQSYRQWRLCAQIIQSCWVCTEPAYTSCIV